MKVKLVPRCKPLPQPKFGVEFRYADRPQPVVEQGKRATYGDLQPRTMHSGGMRQANLAAFSKGNVPDKLGAPMQRLASRLVPVIRAIDGVYDKRSGKWRPRRPANGHALSAQDIDARAARKAERLAKAWAEQIALGRKLRKAGLIRPLR